MPATQRYRRVLAAGAVMVLTACASAEMPGAADRAERAGAPGLLSQMQQDKVAQGRRVARTRCAVCHAMETDGPSPLEHAPPLRQVLLDYDRSALKAGLLDGLRVGHADMPLFSFVPDTVDVLLVYLESIQDWDSAQAARSQPSEGEP